MSLNDKKSALFAKATNAKLDTIQPAKVVKPMTGSNPILPSSSSNTNTNRAPLLSSSNNSSSNTASSGYIPSITPDQKAKKLAEAKEFRDQAAKLLETSMFNWNPDYLAAAPLYDRASAIYKGIGDLELAREMMIQAAVTHKNANCLTAAALAYTKASPIAQSQGRYDLSGTYLEQASELYAISGDIDRGAEFAHKAATELERVSPNRALALYEKCKSIYLCIEYLYLLIFFLIHSILI